MVTCLFNGLESVQTFTPVAGLELSIDAYIQSASQWFRIWSFIF